MTRKVSSCNIIKQTVLVFDICSSSKILEDLTRTENMKKWRDTMIWMKEYLVRNAKTFNFDIYKFTGDGWILFFDENCLGEDIIGFIDEFSDMFYCKIKALAKNLLDSPPDILGLTFGVDEGTLIKIIMQGKKEYVGRAINVACRLQTVIKDNDRKPQYKVLMTKKSYNNIKKYIENNKKYKFQNVTRKLRNIAGGERFRSVKVTIPIESYYNKNRLR